jgi:hypothetical protein
MDDKNKNLITAIRFVLGLGIIGILEAIAYFMKHSPMLPFYGMVVVPPLAMLFFPPIASSIYFMSSSKIRWRLDIISLIISIICLVVFYRASFGNL